jgi:ubiquinone biosynthesis protein COQ9
MTPDPIQSAAIQALLPLAGAAGWTRATLAEGLRLSGQDPALVDSHFPGGAVQAVALWAALTDAAMAAEAGSLEELRIPARVRRLEEVRLGLLAPHRAACRRAAALLAMPCHAPVALGIIARSADAIWRAAGDRSADMSWYTRRASLGAIHAATLAFWLRAADPGLEATMAFLDRRLADLARLQKRPKPKAA